MIRYPFEEPPQESQIIEIAEGVFWLRFPLPMKLDHVNVFAIDDGDGWVIVDTGFHSKRSEAIWEATLAGPLKGKAVTKVVVTHHHPDHIGMAGWFMKRGAELITTRTAWLMARMLTLDVQETPSPEALRFYHRAGMPQDIYDKRSKERPFNFADCVFPLPQGYSRIQEGDRIAIGGRDWDVRIGNGHAPEHATLWSDDLVLGGDQLLPSISPNLGVYPTEPEADPVTDWIEACERLQSYATDTQLVLPGHKLPFTGLPFRLTQLIENHHSALERLQAHMIEPRTAHDCFLPLFKRDIKGGEYGLALVESMAHCNHLYLGGQAERFLDDDGRYRFQIKG
ncbi:MAG: MBL fold metallo-hydrolase [Litoreibacter sp.]